MSNETRTWNPSLTGELETNYVTWSLVGIAAVMQAVAIFGVERGWGASGEVQQSTGPVSVVPVLVAIVAFSLVAVGAIIVARKAPDILKSVLQWVAVAAMVSMIIGGAALMVISGDAILLIGVAAASVAAAVIIESGTGWIFRTTGLVAAGGYLTASLGQGFGQGVWVLFIVAIGVWDHIAVHRSGVMESLSKSPLGEVGTFVIPSQVFAEYDLGADDENLGDVAFLIGLGDLAIPLALSTSAYVAGQTIIALGAFVGMAAAMVRISTEDKDGSQAGIPIIGGATILGWASATAAVLAWGAIVA